MYGLKKCVTENRNALLSGKKYFVLETVSQNRCLTMILHNFKVSQDTEIAVETIIFYEIVFHYLQNAL